MFFRKRRERQRQARLDAITRHPSSLRDVYDPKPVYERPALKRTYRDYDKSE